MNPHYEIIIYYQGLRVPVAQVDDDIEAQQMIDNIAKSLFPTMVRCSCNELLV